MKKKIIGSVMAAILVAGIVLVVIWQRNSSGESVELEIKAGADETIVYATIEQITGNDIDVSLLEEETAQQMIELNKVAKEAAAIADNNFSERTFGSGEMSDMPGGGMPDMSGGGFSGGMPDMSDIESSEVVVMEVPESELSGMPEGGRPNMSNGERPEGEVTENNTTPKEQEKASYRIPVGTDVITTLGATTTFSHLEEGDTIAILMEQDSEAILKIWMIM